MKSWAKGLVLAAVHVGLVASLGAKLLYDRATRPRVWALTAPYDPDLPIRGRYLSLQLVVEPRGIQGPQPESAWQPQSVTLHVADGRLVAEGNAQERGFNPADLHVRFIDRRGEKLWVEVTVPKKGPPRPIRLGLKKSGGPIVPLELR